MEDLNKLLTEEEKILFVRWEALKRNEEYLKLWENFSKTKNKAYFWGKVNIEDLRKKFGIITLLDPYFKVRTQRDILKLINIFCDEKFFDNIEVFVDSVGFFKPNQPFPSDIVAIYINLRYPKERILNKIEEILDAIRKGRGLTEYEFLKNREIVKRKKVKQKRVERNKNGFLDLDYYMKCFWVWDLRVKKGLTFIQIGNEMMRKFPPPSKGYRKKIKNGKVKIKKNLKMSDWIEYDYQERASLAEAYYKKANELINGGFLNFGKLV